MCFYAYLSKGSGAVNDIAHAAVKTAPVRTFTVSHKQISPKKGERGFFASSLKNIIADRRDTLYHIRNAFTVTVAADATNPTTGDPIVVWVGMMVVSMLAAGTLVLAGRRNRR